MEQHKKAVLDAFIELGTVYHACKQAGVGRTTWYNWLKDDPEFAEAVSKAEEDVADDLEQEAIKRAKDGSDTLLIFLLKGHKPEKFKERFQQQHTGQVALKSVPDDELESRIANLLEEAGITHAP